MKLRPDDDLQSQWNAFKAMLLYVVVIVSLCMIVKAIYTILTL
jgi:hypothetical protein